MFFAFDNTYQCIWIKQCKGFITGLRKVPASTNVTLLPFNLIPMILWACRLNVNITVFLSMCYDVSVWYFHQDKVLFRVVILIDSFVLSFLLSVFKLSGGQQEKQQLVTTSMGSCRLAYPGVQWIHDAVEVPFPTCGSWVRSTCKTIS